MAKKKRSNTSTTSATTPQRICDYILYTDGGCSNNPGGVGGIGVVAIDTETGECIEESRGYASTTNNRMEIRAALVALQMVPDGCSVLLHSDSQYLLNTIAGVWQKKKNRDLWKMLDTELNRVGDVSTQWVKGHNGNPYNERCDELATQAMCGELITDEGYGDASKGAAKPSPSATQKPNAQPTSQSKQQQNSTIPEIPEEINGKWVDISVSELSKKAGINTSCAKCICSFYKLCAYGLKCGIPEKQIRKDAYSFLDHLESLTDDESNHFTREDVKDALKALQADHKLLSTMASREWIEKQTKVSIPASHREKEKRLKQKDHLELARFSRDIRQRMKGTKWTDNNGRPDKSMIVYEWRSAHPEGRKVDCIRETGLDKKTVYKWWLYSQKEVGNGKTL